MEEKAPLAHQAPSGCLARGLAAAGSAAVSRGTGLPASVPGQPCSARGRGSFSVLSTGWGEAGGPRGAGGITAGLRGCRVRAESTPRRRGPRVSWARGTGQAPTCELRAYLRGRRCAGRSRRRAGSAPPPSTAARPPPRARSCWGSSDLQAQRREERGGVRRRCAPQGEGAPQGAVLRWEQRAPRELRAAAPGQSRAQGVPRGCCPPGTGAAGLSAGLKQRQGTGFAG